MKKPLLLLCTFVILTVINGCATKVHTQSQETQWKPRGPLFFIAPAGRYKGAIPCKDCPGIEVTLSFNEDNSVVKSMRYIHSKNKNTKNIGTWVVTPGNIVQVSYNKQPPEYYKAQNGGHLVMLNSKKELNINPSHAQFFIFNRD